MGPYPCIGPYPTLQLGYSEELVSFVDYPLVWMGVDIFIDMVFVTDMGLGFFTGYRLGVPSSPLATPWLHHPPTAPLHRLMA